MDTLGFVHYFEITRYDFDKMLGKKEKKESISFFFFSLIAYFARQTSNCIKLILGHIDLKAHVLHRKKGKKKKDIRQLNVRDQITIQLIRLVKIFQTGYKFEIQFINFVFTILLFYDFSLHLFEEKKKFRRYLILRYSHVSRDDRVICHRSLTKLYGISMRRFTAKKKERTVFFFHVHHDEL